MATGALVGDEPVLPTVDKIRSATTDRCTDRDYRQQRAP
jgi:hypothetical protein